MLSEATARLIAATPLVSENLCDSCPSKFGKDESFNPNEFAKLAVSRQLAIALDEDRVALSMKEEDDIARTNGGLGSGRDALGSERAGAIARCLLRRVRGGCDA